jgi:hypothetical protein
LMNKKRKTKQININLKFQIIFPKKKEIFIIFNK